MLAALDPYTLAIAVSIALFTIAVQAVIFQLTARQYQGNLYWTASVILLFVAFVALMLRGRIPDIISILGTNYGAFLSLCLFHDGLAHFERGDRRGVNALNHSLALASIAALMYFTVVDADLNARVVLFNLFQIFISLRLVRQIAPLRHTRQKAASNMLAVVFLTLACVSAIRIYTAATSPPMTSFVKDDLGLRMVMLVDLILANIIWFAVMLMTHTRTQNELEEARSKAERDSHTDRLTGLWNRYHFEAAIRREIERSGRYGHPASLLMLDIDHFKRVNDKHGHLAGDEVLKEVARCTLESTRASDLLCRWGGEEFVILVPMADDDAAKAADKLRQHIEEHTFPVVGRITISIGVAQLRPSDDLVSWMRRADKALYRAKALGRNRVETETLDFALASPMSLQWVPGFTCGDPTIDEQHQSLFNKANRLLECCRAPNGNQIADAMADVMQDAERHFAYEEEVLRRVGYPRLMEHVAEHERLRQRARILLEEFRAGRKAANALASFVVSELAFGHIAEEDVGYVPFIKSRGGEAAMVDVVEPA